MDILPVILRKNRKDQDKRVRVKKLKIKSLYRKDLGVFMYETRIGNVPAMEKQLSYIIGVMIECLTRPSSCKFIYENIDDIISMIHKHNSPDGEIGYLSIREVFIFMTQPTKHDKTERPLIKRFSNPLSSIVAMCIRWITKYLNKGKSVHANEVANLVILLMNIANMVRMYMKKYTFISKRNKLSDSSIKLLEIYICEEYGVKVQNFKDMCIGEGINFWESTDD